MAGLIISITEISDALLAVKLPNKGLQKNAQTHFAILHVVSKTIAAKI